MFTKASVVLSPRARREKICKEVEILTKGMTIGFKPDGKDVIIEAPLDKEKNFFIFNTSIMEKDGSLTFIRKI